MTRCRAPERDLRAGAIAAKLAAVGDRDTASELLSKPLSVEMLAQVGQVLPDGLSVIDTNGVQLVVNDVFCEMTGFSRDAMMGKTPGELYWPPEELDTIRAAFEATLAERFDHFRLTFCRANGERFPVIVSPNVVRDASGEPAFYFAIVKDITEIERAHEAVRDSEARYRTLADSTPYGLAVHIGGIVQYVNHAATELLGASAAELVGRPLSRFVHPDDLELVAARVRALSDGATSAPWARERFRRFDGTYFYADVAGRSVRFREQPAVQVAFRDVTEELERERLASETNRLEAIGQLAGGVAHDFNNLLTVVMAACSIALDHEALPSELRGDLQSATEAARHGSALTRQLLAFSRQEPAEVTAVSVPEELDRIAAVLERMVGEDVVFERSVDPDCWPIRAGSNQLEQVLLNVVANARAAMPNGGHLRVEATNAPAGTVESELLLPATQDFVRIVIDDDGVGMDAKTRAQIFEPFFTTRRAEGGTGLGLATVYGIVVSVGGTVKVESEPGQGTRVTLLWPRAAREAKSSSNPAPTRGPGTETILVVEDQAPVRRIAVRSLERDGYTVLEAEGYTDALVHLEAGGDIDLLLTDIVLRDRTGPAIVDAALALRPALPVMFMSGYANVPSLTPEHAARPLLQKPFTPAALSAAVRAVLAEE